MATNPNRCFASLVLFGALCLSGCSSRHARDANRPGSGSNAGATDPAGGSALGGGAGCSLPSRFQWSSSGVFLSPSSDSNHDLNALKDPTIVFYDHQWHVYATSVGPKGYGMVYMSLPDLAHPAAATTYYMDQTPGFAGYHVAPQLFFFKPQNKWYLVYQSGPPQYSTSDDPGTPGAWTRPASFFGAEPNALLANKGSGGGWLDFWVICDGGKCHLFFSDDNGTLYRSQTASSDFPNGFGDPVVVMKDTTASHLYEASNVYKLKGLDKYLLLVEAYDAGSSSHRYFRSWTADALDGAWTPLADSFATPFASTANVTFSGARWTNDISHGEMIRDGYDETLTIDPCQMKYLYQGFDPAANTSVYNDIPWRLGLLTQTGH